jgi:opacity protein-like surface antigen
MGYVHNHTIEMRSEKEEGSPIGFPNVPFVTGARLGVSDRIDIGLEMFFFAGMAADVKYNFMPPKNPFALSVLGGIGAADQVWAPTGAWVLNVPITLLASYDATDGIVPYAGVGYSTFWIFGREKEAVHSAGDLNERKGHGDGLLTLTAGVRFKIGDRVSIFLEYGYNLPVLDDPGDFFSFEDTHIALAGASVTFRVFGEPARRPVFPTPPPPPPPPPSPGPGPESPQPTI